MEYFDAFISFIKAIFNALTAFLGKSIPVVSDIDAIDTEINAAAEG